MRSLFIINPTKPYYLISCLFHQENTPSLTIYADHGYCHGRCGRWYGYWEIINKVKGLPPQEKREAQQQNSTILSQKQLVEMIEQFYQNLFLMKKEKWFYERGITKDSIQTFKLGHTGRAFSIPILDTIENPGYIRTIRFRRDDSFSTGGSKYWGIPGLNHTCLFAPRSLSERIIWTEGELDAILLAGFNYHTLTFSNGINHTILTLSHKILQPIKEITLAIDQDATSYPKSLELARELRELGKRVRIARFPEKDVTDLYLARGIEGLRKYLGEP